MENQEFLTEIQKLSKEVESHKGVLAHVVGLLVNLSNAVDEGFAKVNERLAILEGKQGMQGVNQQLGEIKTELHKIQKAYPYDELYSNLKSVQGEA